MVGNYYQPFLVLIPMGRFIFSIIIFLILTVIMVTLYIHDLGKQHAGVGLFWVISLVWMLLSIPQKDD